MRQRLGTKKTRRLEALTGRRVKAAFTRGGWEHFWAQVCFDDGQEAFVNYRTGDIESEPDEVEVQPIDPGLVRSLSAQLSLKITEHHQRMEKRGGR
jgi:hypothetical protein